MSAEPGLWWLSFVDTTKSDPPEQQVPGRGGFLGACIVPATDFGAAVWMADFLGCNPGGEIAGIPTTVPDPKWIGRLLSLTEIEELEAEEARDGRP
jgi:hypothetical protein